MTLELFGGILMAQLVLDDEDAVKLVSETGLKAVIAGEQVVL